MWLAAWTSRISTPISILTSGPRRSLRFYAEVLSLKAVYEYLQDDGGFVFLAAERIGLLQRGGRRTVLSDMKHKALRAQDE